MSGHTCALCNEEPGPFPMKWSPRGLVCRDCWAVYDLDRFVEIKPKKEEVDDELAVRDTREV
jgi:hypothetical protein